MNTGRREACLYLVVYKVFVYSVIAQIVSVGVIRLLHPQMLLVFGQAKIPFGRVRRVVQLED